jgi:arylsulfatase A-like enzyme
MCRLAQGKQGGTMNIILVLIDSLNRHYLSAYGPSSAATPHLDAFARRAWRFDRHYVGSLPCMPARREIFAGVRDMLWRPWGPLESFDARLPELLAARGYRTAIVTDHYHYWEDAGNGYIQSFQSAELVRGHELDFWQPPLPADAALPRWVEQIERWRPGMGRRYYANVKEFRSEEDYFPAKVMGGAARWLRKYADHTPFFLQVESFDVHEPFDVPEPYASMYADSADRDRFTIWPPYQNTEQLANFIGQTSAEELAFIRSQYAAKLTMVDRWFGALMAALDELGLWSDTVVIVTTDHGHDLGERGSFGKQYPHYDSHANIPLLLWHPAHPGNGRSIQALTSTVDLFATVLEIAGATPPERTQSQSSLPLLRGDSSRSRKALLYGTFGQGVCCTDGEWTVIKSPAQNTPLYYYSTMISRSLIAGSIAPSIQTGHFIPGVELMQWRIPVQVTPLSTENYLFDRHSDPAQRHNQWHYRMTVRRRMLETLRGLLIEEGSPEEQFARLGLT